jgi:RHS repeat-associated protein
MAGIGVRSVAMGYGVNDGLRQGFTGYERDLETGLDYAQARYYASIVGRFNSVDPATSSFRPENPQSWNRYTYVLNNPLNLNDPTGLDPGDGDDETSFGVTKSFLKGLGSGLKEGSIQLAKSVATALTPFGIIESSINNVNTLVDAASAYSQYLNDAGKINGAVADSVNTIGLNKSFEILGNAIGQVIPQAAADRLLPTGASKTNAASEVAATEGSFQVRRFMSASELKTIKKQGLKFDPAKGEGIPTTTKNFTPRNQSIARKRTGANAVEFQVDLNVTGVPRGPTQITRGGLPEYPIRGILTKNMITNIRKVPKQ